MGRGARSGRALGFGERGDFGRGSSGDETSRARGTRGGERGVERLARDGCGALGAGAACETERLGIWEDGWIKLTSLPLSCVLPWRVGGRRR
jgi:hypothetical protein